MTRTSGLESTPVSHAIFRVARLHKGLAGRLLREAGLHPGQELVLMTLWSSGPQRLVDLAQAVDADAPSMTRSIGRLEKAGLVRRVRSTADRRAVIVEATEASLPLRERVQAAWDELERVTVRALSDAERTGVLDVLDRLEANLLAPADPSAP